MTSSGVRLLDRLSSTCAGFGEGFGEGFGAGFGGVGGVEEECFSRAERRFISGANNLATCRHTALFASADGCCTLGALAMGFWFVCRPSQDFSFYTPGVLVLIFKVRDPEGAIFKF